MAQSDWRTNLARLLDTWDDAINGKVGVPDDPSDRPIVRTKFSSIVRRSGRAHRSSEFDAALIRGLEERRLFMRPPVGSVSAQDVWVAISRDPIPDPVLLFSRESHLQDFLSIESAHLPFFANLEIVKAEYPLPDGSRIDLLMFDRGANDYVVVELKHREAGYGATTQLISYMSMLRKQRADNECRGVRGILLVGSIDGEQREQFVVLAADNRIELATYELELSISVVAAATVGIEPVEASAS